ncbi:MAG: biopolymer transporter ExbD [Planctomycetes bacterium]|nr:biopolymer transporter ExbD [Planctomycetota bacterium]
MALRRRHGGQRGALDFTALVDIALVLVVYFVLASQAAQSRDLPVSLPQAGTGVKPALGTLDLVIDAGGTMTLKGKPLELTDLAGVVKGQPKVTLLADKQAKHGRVIEVVDALRKLGVQEIYYATAAGVEEW